LGQTVVFAFSVEVVAAPTGLPAALTNLGYVLAPFEAPFYVFFADGFVDFSKGE